MTRRREYSPALEGLDGRWLPSALSPWQVQQAYGVNSVTVAGQGQTIAIVDAYHDPYLAGDLATFDRQFGLPGQSSAELASMLSVVNLAGNQTNSGWAQEEALDVEWAHAMASGAKLVVVEAASDSLNDLMAAVNVARNIQGVSVVSMSWGGSEFSGETSYDSYFTTPAGHTPITFVASSGDSGAWGGTEWPSSSPNVVSVGGTTLFTTNTTSTIQSETGWSGSGGGVSSFEGEPSYQAAVQSTGRRTTPDLSLDADPNTGLYTYVTDTSTGRGNWQIFGGTSASAQLFGGILAVTDQVRGIFGKGTLDTQSTLSALYSSSATTLNDITSGVNGYRAGIGYDLVTGLGSPKAFQIYVNLYQPGQVTANVATVSTATTTHTTATPKASGTVATSTAATTTSATVTNTAAFIAAPSTLTSSPTSTANSTASTPAVAAASSTAQAAVTHSNAVPQPLTRGPGIARPLPIHESSGSQVRPPENDAEANAATDDSAAEPAADTNDAAPSDAMPANPAPKTEPKGDLKDTEDAPAPHEDQIQSALDGPRLSAATLIDVALHYYPADLPDLAVVPRAQEEPTQVSYVGVVAAAVAASLYQNRPAGPSATPRGPRELLRSRWESWTFAR